MIAARTATAQAAGQKLKRPFEGCPELFFAVAASPACKAHVAGICSCAGMLRSGKWYTHQATPGKALMAETHHVIAQGHSDRTAGIFVKEDRVFRAETHKYRLDD